MAIPIVGVIAGALKSYIITKLLKAASEEFIHSILDKLADKFVPPFITWMKNKAAATPGKFDDAAVAVVEDTLNRLLEDD